MNVAKEQQQAKPVTDLGESFAKQLETQIIAIDEAIKRLVSGPVKRRAIVLLLNDLTDLPMSDIDKVLLALGELRKTYLK